jgi:hypothetical protein
MNAKQVIELAKTTGKLFVIICDERCATCKSNAEVYKSDEMQKELTSIGVTYAYMTKAEAGGLYTEAMANFRNLAGKQIPVPWPLCGTWKVSATGKVTKVKNGVAWTPDPMTVRTVGDWVVGRLG